MDDDREFGFALAVRVTHAKHLLRQRAEKGQENVRMQLLVQKNVCVPPEAYHARRVAPEATQGANGCRGPRATLL